MRTDTRRKSPWRLRRLTAMDTFMHNPRGATMDTSLETQMNPTIEMFLVLGQLINFNRGRGRGHYDGYRFGRCHEQCHDYRWRRHCSHGCAAIDNSMDHAMITIVDASMGSIMKKAMKTRFISGQTKFCGPPIAEIPFSNKRRQSNSEYVYRRFKLQRPWSGTRRTRGTT